MGILVLRLIAIAIDSFVVWILGVIVGVVAGEQILGIGIGFFVGLAYNWYFWTQNNGQTPAKRALGLRVVASDGSSIDDFQAVVRYVGYYINTVLLLLGWLWAIVDKQNRGLHDILAGTRVVRA